MHGLRSWAAAEWTQAVAGAAGRRRAAAAAGCAYQAWAQRSRTLEGAGALLSEERAAALMGVAAYCQIEGPPADIAAI